MKSTAEKSATSTLIQRSESPFFSKRGEDSFFAATGVQAKIEVGEPGDPYEQEADAMAEKVLQQDKETVQTKPLVDGITPIVRRKQEEQIKPELLPDQSTGVMGGTIQSKVETASTPATVSPSVESQLQFSKGGGEPLPSKTREEMETGFGTDFNGVRIHRDTEATRMNQELGAQAFTHGNDVYFNDGKYNPESTEGKRLLAHELTHTVQQSGSVQRQLVQRDPVPEGGAPTNEVYSKNITAVPAVPASETRTVVRNGSGYKLNMPRLNVPSFKTAPGFTPTTNLEFNYPMADRSDSRQRTRWLQGMQAKLDQIKGKVDEKLSQLRQANQEPRIADSANLAEQAYAFKVRGTSGGQTDMVVGTTDAIARRMIFPNWSPTGRLNSTYEVDHKREMQIGGEDVFTNIWLLEARTNGSSGNAIKNEKNEKINNLLGEVRRRNITLPIPTEGSPFLVHFDTVLGGLSFGTDRSNLSYTPEDIYERGTPLNGLEPMTRAQMESAGLTDASKLKLFQSVGGGVPYIIDLNTPGGPPAAGPPTTIDRDLQITLGANASASHITFNPQTGGYLTTDLFQSLRHIPGRRTRFRIRPMVGIPMAGYIPQGAELIESLADFNVNLLSPIEFVDAHMEPGNGLVARGRVLPTVPFLNSGSGIELVVEGNNISLEKTFNSGEINLPAPFRINDCSLTISVGTAGVRATGVVDFGIDRVGNGRVEGFVGSDGKYGIRGTFNFDSQLFNPAAVTVEYVEGQLVVQGNIGIPRGKVRGIKQATANVRYADGTLTAEGNADLDVKGLQRGTMSLRYTQEQLTIGGTFQLSNEIPRIRSGEVAVTVTKTGEEYQVTASGTAQPDIPGLDASISVSYNNGALTIEGSADYQRGIARGRVRVGSTNCTIDPATNTPNGPPGDRWVVYGEGELSLRLTPWLQATAGVRFSPTGELTVMGRIGLPGTVNVFDRKEFNRRLLNFPTVEIPLLAIPVGPRSVGLVATIGGGIDFNAGIGPGRLEELFGEVSYTVGQDDSLSLHGRGKFVIPADATIRIFGRLGVGLSIGIARVTGNIELGAAVGIRGAAEAEVDVNWDARNGISLDAVGRIYVEPVLRLDISLVAEAVLDLYLYEFRKEWRKTLAQREFGSGMRYGLEFPVHYQEGQPFDISPDQMRVIQPEIDIGAAARRFGQELFD